jgi:predicted O-methyltransferase YrrM
MPTPPSDLWARVDRFVTQHLARPDAVLDGANAAGAAAGLPPIQVSAPQGRLLEILARAIGARRVLEIGTLAGYSTIWLARALPPDGRLISLEIESRHAEIARANLSRAGLAARAEVRVGPATASLAHLAQRNEGPFDLVFLDADKPGYPGYLPALLRLSRPGTLLVADNVVRNGAVADPSDPDPNIRGVREFLVRLGEASGIAATVVQTVGAKGYDGMAIALVTEGVGPGGSPHAAAPGH